VTFWLLTPTWNQVLRLAMVKTILRRKKKKKKKIKNKKKKQQQQQQQASAEIAITNTGQRNHQPNWAAVCVLFTAKEMAHSAPDVTWACAWCLVSQNITQK